MDYSSSKRQNSKASSKKSKKKKRVPKTQNAGQQSGPEKSSATSQRSKSRSAAEDDEESPRSRSRGQESSTGSETASCTIKAIHAFHFGIGLALIIYGAMVSVTEVTAACVAYGLLLLLGAIAGGIGFYSGACSKRGLWISTIAGILLFLLDLGAFFFVLLSWESFVQFLHDNHKELNLTENSVDTIDGLRFPFAIIFLVFAVVEAYRFSTMWALKDTMATSGRVAPLGRKSRNGSKCDWFLSLFGLKKRKKTADFVVFDDNASMESSLIWSQDGTQPTTADYLEFVPEHERSLTEYATKVSLPKPAEDRTDY